ncbi:hypothetical protein TR70_4331 [Burkholderia pseudomallei]|nr:hypothetical protein TR70_4331 [Burkholderia pseudomallei]
MIDLTRLRLGNTNVSTAYLLIMLFQIDPPQYEFQYQSIYKIVTATTFKQKPVNQCSEYSNSNYAIVFKLISRCSNNL